MPTIANLGAFIHTLYENKTLPPIMVVDDVDDALRFYQNTKAVPVLCEEEDIECPLFDDWGTYYAFEGWVTYRSLTSIDAFREMTADVLSNTEWSQQTADWITIIHGLVTVQEKYADKFGHYPARLSTFIKSYLAHDAAYVLSANRY